MSLKVAIVEDEPLSRRRLFCLLKEAGCEIVAQFEEGQSLLDWLDTCPAVDAVFLDVQMPGKSGFDVVKELRTPIPVVFVTGHIEFQGNDFGPMVVDYLVKPIFSDNIAGSMRKLRQYMANAETDLTANAR